MNLPNFLTISRIILTAVLVYLLNEASPLGNIWAAVVFAIASLTDFYDGHLAKSKGLISDFGKIMDPIADKVLMLSTFGVLTHIGMVPWWVFVVIAIREILVTVSRLWAMRQGQVLAAERAGKIKTVIQIASVSLILLYLIAQQSEACSYWFYNIQHVWQWLNQGLLLAAAIVTVYSGMLYFRNKK